MQRFAYLKIGLAAVLVVVGAKMLVAVVYHAALQVPVGGLGAAPLVPKDKMRCERMARVTPNS
jgi:predicted tellurium resistance membrane protein TerC